MRDDVEGEVDPLLAEGTRVDDFWIRGFLGEGAMGQVYLAKDLTLERRVALKFIKRSVLDRGGIERFLEEARTTAIFSHPHIVTLHAVGEHEGRPYLALEYLDGESLRARVARLLDRLVDRGIIVERYIAEGEDVTLEVAPEALVTAWPQLARWLDEIAMTSSAITGSERRFLFAVLLGRASEVDAPTNDALRRTSKAHGGRLEQLADGSLLVVLDADRQVATDQAAQAARCALALHALVKDRPMAIAMGRAESTGKLPEGDVLDRVSRLLSGVEQASGKPPPIALDEIIASLLDARFEVMESDTGLTLRGERPLMQARTVLGRPTSCVGRDWELSALAGIVDECIDERRARAVVVTAAPGMGKSRSPASS